MQVRVAKREIGRKWKCGKPREIVDAAEKRMVTRENTKENTTMELKL